MAIISKLKLDSRQYEFLYINIGGTYGLRLNIADTASTSTSLNKNTTLSNATWYHVVVTYDLSAGTAEYWVNGVSLGTTAGGATSLQNGDGPFTIANRAEPDGAAGICWDGAIDEIGVWAKILTDGEIKALYNDGSAIPYEVAATTSIKSINGLAYASIKSVNGLAVASVKSFNNLE